MDENSDEDKILDMKLHDKIWFNNILMEVVKVPGGWIYSTYVSGYDTVTHQTFVPDTRRRLMV